ncbi:MAG TPA: hypothetical protein DCE56_18420 [Cyanobacteria bacterium UBA8553]|nr:hypothetical protein [Cyanobacteria bacterium UBA8553]HAJ63265.1 hypothetical protein [Cyanobacteria bacterium UBA8543]
MIQNAQTPQEKSIPMPITQEAQQIAIDFASEQPTPQKALQVYLNTLAVCTVNNYLRIMDIPTDLTAGDSWNPSVRLATDVADLLLVDLGLLECRPVQKTKLDIEETQTSKNYLPWQFLGSKPTSEAKSAPSCYIPPGIQDDRIGYVVVEIDAEQQEATLLGFSATAVADELPISQLQPINDLLKYLENQKPLPVLPVNLSQWWRDVFEVGWQSVEGFLDTQIANYAQSQMAFRRSSINSITRAKLLNFGKPKFGVTVALVVTLTQQEAANFGISLQVFPQVGETYLPVGLKLAVLDESGTSFFETSSGNSDRLLQTRQFGGQSGEQFRTLISLDEHSITEDFVI